jgi:hypothetical protein
MNIKCLSLYDITQTNISFRKRSNEIVREDERTARGQQSNLETIFQIINMRSQPENISEITRQQVAIKNMSDYRFGYTFTREYHKIKTVNIWSFTFSVEHVDVFNNGLSELGYLLSDCDRVPMITELEESFKLSPQISISDETRNVYFEIMR